MAKPVATIKFFCFISFGVPLLSLFYTIFYTIWPVPHIFEIEAIYSIFPNMRQEYIALSQDGLADFAVKFSHLQVNLLILHLGLYLLTYFYFLPRLIREEKMNFPHMITIFSRLKQVSKIKKLYVILCLFLLPTGFILCIGYFWDVRTDYNPRSKLYLNGHLDYPQLWLIVITTSLLCFLIILCLISAFGSFFKRLISPVTKE